MAARRIIFPAYVSREDSLNVAFPQRKATAQSLDRPRAGKMILFARVIVATEVTWTI
jgi:hypothetical protein